MQVLRASDVQEELWSISLRVKRERNLTTLDGTQSDCGKAFGTKPCPDIGSFCYRSYICRSTSKNPLHSDHLYGTVVLVLRLLAEECYWNYVQRSLPRE